MNRKIWRILCLTSGGIFLAMAVWFAAAMQTLQSAPAVGIIGGADWPTAIFLTQRLFPYPQIAAVALLICIVSGVALLIGRNKK